MKTTKSGGMMVGFGVEPPAPLPSPLPCESLGDGAWEGSWPSRPFKDFHRRRGMRGTPTNAIPPSPPDAPSFCEDAIPWRACRNSYLSAFDFQSNARTRRAARRSNLGLCNGAVAVAGIWNFVKYTCINNRKIVCVETWQLKRNSHLK